MNNFYKGGRGLCLPDTTVETQHLASLRKKQRPNPQNQDNPQNNVCDIRRGEPRRALRRKISFAQYGRHTSTRKRANNYSSLPLILIFICCLFNNAALAQSRDTLGAVDGVGDIKPLQIGDTIPETLWHMPLQVVNHPEGKDTVTLNDYRGKKLIILDFLHTQCISCLQKLDAIRDLQISFDEDLSVIVLTKQRLSNIYKTLDAEKINSTQFPWSYSVDHIAAYFPYRIVSHFVLIHNGVVYAITRSGDITADKIGGLIQGESVEFSLKDDFKEV